MRQALESGLARVVAIVLALAASAGAYSVLTHEEVVDLLWKDDIVPLVQQRYPDIDPQGLKECHAYAYGGAVIQDLGYYPFGSHDFSNLVHYVRSGEFVQTMIEQAQDSNEFCFAIGALAHYTSDVNGHPAVNASVADLYPKLQRKFGRLVTYADDRTAHLKTEFGFDVAQVAKHRYTSDQYHDFIGFKVSQPLLERVFPIVYGLEVRDVMAHEDLAVGTFRWAVSGLIPQMTKVAWQTHRDEIVKDRQDLAEREFLYHLSRANYQREWDGKYQRPGIGTRVLAFFLQLLPKVGPLRALSLRPPTPQTEDLYFKSIDATVDRYRAELVELRAGPVALPDRDLDTGKPVAFDEYSLSDETYRQLCVALADHHFERMSPALRRNILAFFAASPSDTFARNEKRKDQAKVEAALEQLKNWTPAAGPTTAAR